MRRKIVKKKGKKKPNYLQTGGNVYDNDKSAFANYIEQGNEDYETAYADIDKGIAGIQDRPDVTTGEQALGFGAAGLQGFATGSQFGPLGGIIGAGVGIGTRALNNNKRAVAESGAEASAIEEARFRKKELKGKQEQFQKDAYANVLEGANTEGSNNVSYFAGGGNLPKRGMYAETGGNLNEIAEGVDKVEGNSHAQGGVDLAVNNEIVAEVEDKEIIMDDDMVFSDKLGYAKEAEKLAKKKAKFEGDLKSNNTQTKNTAIRMTAQIDMKMERLFEHQEATKPNETKTLANGGNLPPSEGVAPSQFPLLQASTLFNEINTSPRARLEYELANPEEEEYGSFEIPEIEDQSYKLEKLELPKMDTYEPPRTYTAPRQRFATGGNLNKINKGLQFALPLAENLYNASLINKTPSLPKREELRPNLLQPAELETDVNINPQLAQIQQSTREFNTGVDRSTNNANVGRANKLAAHIKGLEQANTVRGQKENIETDLRNKDKLNRQSVQAQNLANINAYDRQGAEGRYSDALLETQQANEITSLKSQNVAKLTEDVLGGIRQGNQEKLDKRKIDLDLLQYGTGVQGKLLQDPTFVNELKGDKSRQDAFKELIKDRPDFQEQWNELFPNNKAFSEKLKQKSRQGVRGIQRRPTQSVRTQTSGELALPNNI